MNVPAILPNQHNVSLGANKKKISIVLEYLTSLLEKVEPKLFVEYLLQYIHQLPNLRLILMTQSQS